MIGEMEFPKRHNIMLHCYEKLQMCQQYERTIRESPQWRHNGRASVSKHHTIVYSSVYSGADQRKHQSSASLTFVLGIHRGPVNSPHKWPVTRKMFPFDDVIMYFLTLVKYTYDLSVNSLLKRTAIQITNYGIKSFKIYGVRIRNLFPAWYKMGCLSIHIKTWLKWISVI